MSEKKSLLGYPPTRFISLLAIWGAITFAFTQVTIRGLPYGAVADLGGVPLTISAVFSPTPVFPIALAYVWNVLMLLTGAPLVANLSQYIDIAIAQFFGWFLAHKTPLGKTVKGQVIAMIGCQMIRLPVDMVIQYPLFGIFQLGLTMEGLGPLLTTLFFIALVMHVATLAVGVPLFLIGYERLKRLFE